MLTNPLFVFITILTIPLYQKKKDLPVTINALAVTINQIAISSRLNLIFRELHYYYVNQWYSFYTYHIYS